jgi:hypothetical protein
VFVFFWGIVIILQWFLHNGATANPGIEQLNIFQFAKDSISASGGLIACPFCESRILLGIGQII